MLVPQVLKQAVAEIDASINMWRERVKEKSRDLKNAEEYLHSLLQDRDLLQRVVILIEREK